MNEHRINNDANGQNTCWICLKIDDNVDAVSCDEVLWLQKQTSISTNLVIKSPDIHKRRICIICRQLLKKCVKFTMQCQKALEIIMEMEDSGKDNMNCSTPFQSIHNFQTNIFNTSLCLDTACGLNVKIQQQNYYYDYNDLEFKNDNDGLKNNAFQNINKVNGFENNANGLINNYELEDNYNYIALDDNYDLSDEDLPLKILSKRESKTSKKRRKSLHSKKPTKSAANKIRKDPESSLKKSNKNNYDRPKKNANNGFSTRMVQETDEYTVIKLTKEQVIEEMRVKASSEQYTRSLYKCDKCVKGFNFEEVLNGHLRKHSPENGDLKCDICEQYCPSAVSLRGHMKSHTTRYECKICSTIKLSRQHLLEHFGISHTDAANTYSCEHCQFVTKKRTVIQRHVRIHKTNASHTCELCGRLFTNVASLRVHTTRHDKSKSLQCNQCTRKFIYPSLLQKHILAVHERSDYYCVECDVTFKSPDNLRLHFKKAKKHRDPSSYTHECPECSVKFISAPSLAVHLTTTHGQPKTHACHLCPRLYSNKESLQGHRRRRHNNTD